MYSAFLQLWCNGVHCKSAYIKTDSIVICVPCLLKHVCHEPFSFKNCRFGRYANWLNFVYYLKFTRLRPDLSKQLKIYDKTFMHACSGNLCTNFVPLAS